jgi:glycosyltransferase involved in cell wall biosynthesis
MRITFVSPIVNLGGGTRVMAIHAAALARMGHAVQVVSPPPRRLPLRRRVKALLQGKGWPRNVTRPASHLDGLALEHRVLERWRPVVDADVPDADVVVATWWETAEWVAALHPRKGAKAYFIQHHEIFPYTPAERVRATYRLPLHKIVIAPWLARLMREEYGDPVIDLVPNSVDRSQFHAPPRGKQPRPTVGFLYSRAGFKGVDVTLKAIRHLRESIPSLRVLSFGSQRPEGDPLFLPWIEFEFCPAQDRLRDIYACCDAWLTASRSEGFNLPAMEAMACRAPVVATPTGWPAEAVVSGANGMLVGFDDDRALAKAAQTILALPPAQWRAMSDRAYATASAGSWEQSSRMFEAALLHARRRFGRRDVPGSPMPLGLPHG